MRKGQLRSHHLALRNAIPVERRIEHAIALSDHAAAIRDRTEGRTVASYHPIRSELDPRPLMAAMTGVRFCLPAIVDRTTLQFRELVRTGELVDAGGYGTVAPPDTATRVDPDVLLMPLSVFDRQGGRIGYGAGYYDHAIATLRKEGRKPLLIGLAFDEQQAAHVPQESHDMPLHIVLTPTRSIECSR